MIVGQVELDEVLSRLSVVGGTLGRPANPTLCSAKEFKAEDREQQPFFKRGDEGQESIFDGKRA
jgi:hypothetical protein